MFQTRYKAVSQKVFYSRSSQDCGAFYAYFLSLLIFFFSKITVARLVESKYPWAVFEIFQTVLASGKNCTFDCVCFHHLSDPDAVLVVIGDGPLAAAVREKAQRQASVRFLGAVDDEVCFEMS